MKEKLERVIAALEVEAAMIESHAQRLLEMVPSLAGNEQRHEMLELAKEETERAEAVTLVIVNPCWNGSFQWTQHLALASSMGTGGVSTASWGVGFAINLLLVAMWMFVMIRFGFFAAAVTTLVLFLLSNFPIAGTGLGDVSGSMFDAIQQARERGIPVVISTRVPTGRVFPLGAGKGSALALKRIGCVLADDLSPQKARILLMLALTKTHDPAALQKYFDN
jgi:hypothetical protein